MSQSDAHLLIRVLLRPQLKLWLILIFLLALAPSLPSTFRWFTSTITLSLLFSIAIISLKKGLSRGRVLFFNDVMMLFLLIVTVVILIVDYDLFLTASPWLGIRGGVPLVISRGL